MTSDFLPALYVKCDCPRCADIVSFLDEHGIAYRLREVSRDPVAAEELRQLSTQLLVPTLDWHGQIVIAPSSAQLAVFLNAQEVELEDS